MHTTSPPLTMCAFMSWPPWIDNDLILLLALFWHVCVGKPLTCMHVWMHVYICMHACMHVCVCMHMSLRVYVYVGISYVCVACIAHANVSLHIFVRLHCALEAVGSSPHKTYSHKTYTTIGTGWSYYPARQQATTSTYRWSEGVARCKHKCVCMCMYLRMYVCTMLYACMCVLCMHVYVYVFMHACVYVWHASVCACVRVCM